jgi:murein DD-endopeptidase MepM/ murein hydrolase activator NlpD
VRAGSPLLIYISDNIGPTSTGPHLDVKRVDGQEFAPNALDSFIEVEDPELGRVPLSKVPITGDFAEHKARGSHGIDYGLYSGTQVFAKNGAKVVDTQPSEHGDVVTIELPNGLRYTFLHGTAPK